MAILSIQSRVVSGYVGNAAATPVLQRLGQTVWPIDTVTFSNHPAHGAYTGGIVPASTVRDLANGLDAQGCFASCDALLSGYLGAVETGAVILDAAARIRRANPGSLWFCDPVMGDNGAFYVADGIPTFFRDQALAAADIILPNAFEAGYLSGIPVDTPDSALKAAGVLLKSGPATVVITGVRSGTAIGALAATAEGIWHCQGPEMDTATSGAGDAFAALFTGNFLKSRNAAAALAFAVSGIHAVLQETSNAKAGDLRLIDALPAIDALALLPVQKIS